MSTMKVITEAVTVKNAVMIRTTDEEENTFYSVIHYDHEVLKIVNNQIVNMFPVSMSTIRAINQALDYLGIDESIDDFCRRTGIDVKAMKRDFKDNRKTFSLTPRMNRNELLKDFIPL